MTLPSVLLEMALAAQPAAEASKPHFYDPVVSFFHDSGSFIFVNVTILAVAMAIIVERSIALYFRLSLPAGPFMEQVSKAIETGNLDRASKLCASAPHSPLAKVVRAGIINANRGELEVSRKIEEALLEHLPAAQARVGWLWSIANIATLVGLVGTISGLIETFKSLGNLPADQKAAKLSEGISTAMNNTFFGLLIAVICIIFHLILGNASKHMVETVELWALKLENLLARKGSGAGRGSVNEAA